MALSKIDVSKMITGVTPLTNGGTGGTSIPATNLASGVTGTLPVGSGGTGLTSGTTDQLLKFTGSTTLASSAISTGKVLQVVTGNTSSTVNNNTQNYATSNSVAITPTLATSKIFILVSQEWRMETAEAIHLQIVRDSTVRVQTETGYQAGGAGDTNSGYWPYKFLDSPNSTSSITYSVKFKATTSGNACSTQTNSTPSSITLMEIGV